MRNCLIIKGADFHDVAIAQVEIVNKGIRISCIVSPSGAGTISGAGYYSENEIVTLEAVPNIGYNFEEWSDGVTTAQRTITVGSTQETYTAIFSEDVYQLFGLVLKENPSDGKQSMGHSTNIPNDTNPLINIRGILLQDTRSNRLSTIPSISTSSNIFRGKTKIEITPKSGYKMAVGWGNTSKSSCNTEGSDIYAGNWSYTESKVTINLTNSYIENIAVMIAPVDSSNLFTSANPRDYLTIELS